MSNNTKAIIITIGDELLIGQTIDTNSAFMAQLLNKDGIDVVRRVAIGDTEDAIRTALNEESPKADIFLITGGLGPTADDITKPLLCNYFGGKLVMNDEVLAHVAQIFSKRNRPFLERNRKQAEVPDVCTVIFNRKGTAPGMWFEKNGKVYVSMPGVPFEMQAMMEELVMPKLRERFFSKAIVHRSVITAGEGESFVAEQINDIENALPPYIKLAYLPQAGMVKLRLTGKGVEEKELRKEVELWQSKIANRLTKIVVAMEDIPLEEILGNLLAEKEKTLSTAESCTGGNIAHRLTQQTGSSAYFWGGVVAYNNSLKQRILHVSPETLETHGAVSEQTVIEMAVNTVKLLGTDYSIAVSGILGPTGGTEEKPVGTVWMAVADKEHVVTKKHQFYHDRLRNKELAANAALLMAWRFVKGLL